MVSPVTVFEYGYLSPALSDNHCSQVTKASYDYLESLCLREDDSRLPFLRLRNYRGHKALQVRNYVGVIHLPTGLQIEVLPKVSRNDSFSPETSRKALLNMLSHLREFRHIETTDAQIATQKLPLIEIFIQQFLQNVNLLVKRGLRSEYLRREDNQQFMKGKLLSTRHLKHNLVNKHRFYVEYDEYLQDRPVNRLIHTALHRVSGYTRSNNNQKLCHELLLPFSNVPLSQNPAQDFSIMRVTRGMEHYQKPLNWARMIIEGISPLSMVGTAGALSLLFPMEAIFETYVGSILRKQISRPYQLKEQARSKYLVQYNGEKWFNLKPDFLIQHKGKPVVVLDTKWKLIDSQQANSRDKMGMSQADFYQMFAYGEKYLKGKGNVVLIYPKTSSFSEPVPFSFDFTDELKLWVVPFDIAADTADEKRLCLLANTTLDSWLDTISLAPLQTCTL